MATRAERNLKNFARGSGTYHDHRLEIVRNLLEAETARAEPLSDFLRTRLFKLQKGWALFSFAPKDWQLCERLLDCRTLPVEIGLLDLVAEYVLANLDSVNRLYDLSARISDRLLREEQEDLAPDSDVLSQIDGQSLFGIRTECAALHSSTDAMIEKLSERLTTGWARARLINPLVYHVSGNPPATLLDNFLSYIVTGKEHDAEKLALKLLLSDEAARDASLAFKIYVGLMGHPFDALEFVLDHVEYEVAKGCGLADHLASFVRAVATALPKSRAAAMSAALSGVPFLDGTRPEGLTGRFGLSTEECARYAGFFSLEPLPAEIQPGAERPFSILINMRLAPYPDPLQFQIITALAAVWHFTDAGRLVRPMLRSIYMVDRASRDLEARDVFRLLYLLGFANPFVASAPSAMFLLRALADGSGQLDVSSEAIEASTDAAIQKRSPFEDRLWINDLQWKLRRLEEEGRVQDWLEMVRSQTKLRPSYLTGVNWHWVEDVIAAQRLKPFRSFEGAYLFVHMELEASSDPQRLRLTLDPLMRGLTFKESVDKIMDEFGVASQAIVRRYFTTSNLLASGFASNYVAALDQRVRALEACIKRFDFGPLLPEEVYDSEVRALTAELLLTDVNAGKFEVPWDTFRNDAADIHLELYRAVSSLRSRFDEEGPLTAIIDTPIAFPNGRTQLFRVRNRDQPLFGLIMALISGFMQHPAFGLEVILSGRFRHNNLIQEVWAAIADVSAAQIPSVTQHSQARLIEGYRAAAEEYIDEWCFARMQTKRSTKPQGLFDLVPDARDVEVLLSTARDASGMLGVIDVVTDWIKAKLRFQVAHARDAFGQEASASLAERFAQVRDQQLDAGVGREQDIQKVHAAVTDAVLRRIEHLQTWFDGVDSVNGKPISLADLSLATETLFENMIPGRTLKVRLDQSAVNVRYDPAQVKIAFDLLREVYFNALRKGRGPVVDLQVQSLGDADNTYSFKNETDECSDAEIGEHEVAGHRYLGPNEAVRREGNSGRAKIAASSATLLGRDTKIRWKREGNSYELLVHMAGTSETSR